MNQSVNDYKAQGLMLIFAIMIGSMLIAQSISMLMNTSTSYQYDLITQGLAVCSFAMLIGILAYAIRLDDKCYKMIGVN